MSSGVTSNPTAIKEEIVSYFKKLFNNEAAPRPTLEGISFSSISKSSKIWFNRKFEEEEVKVALSKCGEDKALALDSFNFSFIKKQLGTSSRRIYVQSSQNFIAWEG